MFQNSESEENIVNVALPIKTPGHDHSHKGTIPNSGWETF
jgi:hypothetical protein